MNFILFLLSYAVNPLILAFIPNELAVNFLGGFTTFNTIFSLLFTLGFSQIERINNQKNILISMMIAMMILALIVGFFQIIFAVIFLYPFSLLYCDYIMTQGGRASNLVGYRLFLMLTGLLVVLIALYSETYYLEAILARSLLILAYATISFSWFNKFSNLKISSPLSFIINTYIFYSGALLLLVYLNEAGSVGTKYWYIALQIALGLLLKFIDFSVRKNGETKKIIGISVIALAWVSIIFVSFLYFSSVNIIIAIIAVAGLSRILFGIKKV